MIADFQIALGGGHAGASLAFERSPTPARRANVWLALVCTLLTLPFALGLALSAVATYTHAFAESAVPAWLFGGGNPGWGRVLAIGPLLALLLFAIARLRFHSRREGGRWIGGVTARLDRWEIAVAVMAVAIVVVFVGHLLADGFACANGVTSAC
jgi:hypothetical protein